MGTIEANHPRIIVALAISMILLLVLSTAARSLPFSSAFAQELEKPKEKKNKEAKIDSETIKLRDEKIAKKQNSISPLTEDRLRVVLDLKNPPTSSQILRLLSLGIEIEQRRHDLLQLLVPPSQIETLASFNFVDHVRQPQYVKATVLSEGAAVIGSDVVNVEGYTGQDVKIAVIDVGFDLDNPEIAANVVEAKSFRADGNIATSDHSHGTAVAEIILDIVPDAQLFLYNVDTDVSLLNALDYIHGQQNVDIATMSLAVYNAGPLDGTSEISQAVNAIRDSGILFVVAAGNEARRHWGGNFVDPDSNGWRNFSGDDETLSISARAGQTVEIYLSWDDWPVSTQDYDLYVFDDVLNLLAFSESPQILGFQPRESIVFVAPYTGMYHIGIFNFSASQDVVFDLFTYPIDLSEYNVPSGSVTIPADAAGALTVGAAFWKDGQLEPFSSRGPTNDGRIKPDIVAPDGVKTSALSPFPFFGTSAAAPHVAGAAALVKDVYPNSNATTIQLLLEENTLDNHEKNNDDGTGLVQIAFILDRIPIANAGEDQIVGEGSVVTLNGTLSSDSDGTLVSFLWEQVDGSTNVTLSDNTSPIASFTAPLVSSNIDLVFRLAVTDDLGASNSDEVTITIQNINQPPIANAGPDQSVNEGILVILNGSSSSDPDGDILSYSWEQIAGPAVILSDSNTASPSFVAPEVESIGATLTFELTVGDGSDTGSDTVDIIVNDVIVNQPPFANAGADQTVDEGDLVILNGTESIDPDGDLLSYSWVQTAGPLVSLNDLGSATPSFIAPPVDSSGATLTFELTVSDGIAQDTDIINIIVENVNQPPIADAGLDQTVDEGSLVTLNGTASSDPDDDTLTFSWVQIAGPNATLSDATSPTPSFTALEVDSAGAVLTFELTIDDGNGGTATDSVDITVQNINQPPVADAGSDQVVDEGTLVTLNGTGSSDPDNDPLTYSWLQISGPSVELFGANTTSPSFTAPEVDSAGATLAFELTVTDSNLLSSSDVVNIFVENIGLPPTADAGANQTVNEGDLVTLNGTGSDDSAEGLTPTWTQISGPGVELSDINAWNATFTAPLVSSDTLLVFQLTVTDADGLQDSDTVEILVLNVNVPPVANAGSDQVVNEGSIVNLDGSASSDSDGTITSFSWAQKSGPAVALNDPNTTSPTFVAPEVQGDTILEFELTIVDNNNATATDVVTVTVKNVLPSPPSGGGRGGGGGARVVPLESPASFFLINPFKIIVFAAAFNLEGENIVTASEGNQIQVGSTLINTQQVSQDYVYIVQVLDAQGIAVEISTHHGSIDADGISEISKLWQPSEKGNYTIQIFVWDSISAVPNPLSSVTAKTIAVN
jgi:subtilisin family serine protease